MVAIELSAAVSCYVDRSTAHPGAEFRLIRTEAAQPCWFRSRSMGRRLSLSSEAGPVITDRVSFNISCGTRHLVYLFSY